MKVITVSKELVNPLVLPGMGRSIELVALSHEELLSIQQAFASKSLYISFTQDPDTQLPVQQLWADPHGPQVTCFV